MVSRPRRRVGVAVGGFAHEGGFNGPGEPQNSYLLHEATGIVEASGAGAATWCRPEVVLEHLDALELDFVRTTIEWARVEPTEHHRDAAVLNRYLEDISAYVARGLEVEVRLFHEVVPAWAGEEFWLWPGSPERFAEHCAPVIEALGSHVGRFVSMVDPTRVALGGWITAEAPPRRRGALADARLVLDNFVSAHLLVAELVGELGTGATMTCEVSPLLADHGVLQEVVFGREPQRAARAASGVALADLLGPQLAESLVLRGEFTRARSLHLDPMPEVNDLDLHLVPLDPWLSLGGRSGPVSLGMCRAAPTTVGALTRTAPSQPEGARLGIVDQHGVDVVRGVVDHDRPSIGIEAFFEQRLSQLAGIDAEVDYLYDGLVDGYQLGQRRRRTGLFGLDLSRGGSAPRWLSTNARGEDAAGAFNRFARALRASGVRP